MNKTLDIKSIIYCLFLIKSNSMKYKIYPEQSAGDCGRRRQRQEGETGKLELVKDRATKLCLYDVCHRGGSPEIRKIIN